jgi:hypothetical protein
MTHAYRKYVPAFPRPKDMQRKLPPVIKIYPDGREVIDTNRVEGWNEYRRRVYAMLDRQRGFCCLFGICPSCTGPLCSQDATFEHQDSRGMNGSHRDDRIIVDGWWTNGAAHHDCNQWKSSRRIQYNLDLQARLGGQPASDDGL